MVVTTVAVTVTSSSPAASSSQQSHSQQGSSPRPAMRGSSKPQTAARDPCRAPSADHMHRLFVIICRLVVVIAGKRCMRTHPILSSQRGLRRIPVSSRGPSARRRWPPRSLRRRRIAFWSHLHIQQARSRKAAALLPTVGAHLETVSGRHRPCSMGMSSHLRPAAGRRVGGCAATEVARCHWRPALTCFFLRTSAAMCSTKLCLRKRNRKD